MRCFKSFIKINPCRGVINDYKVRDKIGAGGEYPYSFKDEKK
jgi:hypothetical protein